jgi:2-C-methyl-D-erythritol 4-phosphate cytidylyltransferase
MVEWSIDAFRAARGVRSIVVACPPGHVHDLGGHDLGVVDGGETRAASVTNALAAVGTELVAIHDAARPLITPVLVEEVVATLLADPEADGAIAAAPITDTVKQAKQPRPRAENVQGTDEIGPSAPGVVEKTIDRGLLWAAQTPQVFRVEAIRGALESASAALEATHTSPDCSGGPDGALGAATDEAMLIEAAGGRVLIHPAPAENIKVTTPLDLKLAERLIAERSAR